MCIPTLIRCLLAKESIRGARLGLAEAVITSVPRARAMRKPRSTSSGLMLFRKL